MRSVAFSFQACVLRERPLGWQGLLHNTLPFAFWLSLWIIADPQPFSESLRIHFAPPSLSLGRPVPIGEYSVREVFSAGSGSSVTVPVSGCCRGVSRLRGCYGYLSAMLGFSQALPATFWRHQFPSSLIGDEFKYVIVRINKGTFLRTSCQDQTFLK